MNIEILTLLSNYIYIFGGIYFIYNKKYFIIVYFGAKLFANASYFMKWLSYNDDLQLPLCLSRN